MRNMIGALALALTLTSARPAAAAEPPTATSPATQVNLHLLGLFFDQLHVEVERRITPQWTVLLAPNIGLGGATSGVISEVFGRSAGFEAGGRWFPGEGALKGFYLQPMLSYTGFYPKDGSGHLLGVHGRVGYQWLVANKVTFNLGTGVVYRALWTSDSSSTSGSFGREAGHFRGFLPDGSFSIGVAF